MWRVIIPILVIVLIEFYSFKGVFVMTQGMQGVVRKSILWAFWIITAFSWLMLFYMMSQRRELSLNTHAYGFFNFVMGTFIILVTTKILFGLFHLINDLILLVSYIVTPAKVQDTAVPHEGMTRFQFFNQAGLAISTIWLGLNLYGVTRGKFSYRVLQEKINFPDLPNAFDGMRIVQISDLHLGSFNENFDSVQEGFDMINALQPDYIFFTGDLVNNSSDEAEPWVQRLAGLKARYGKFSILGNHDYGDYGLGEYPEKKAQSFKRLVAIHAEAGFRLLRNENVVLEKDGERIRLIGTENWGLGFHQYGDLDTAIAGVEESEFKILLSHDPTHWQEHVVGKEVLDTNDSIRAGKLQETLKVPARNIALTLSGHTHGAQFGVELPSLGIKFSPVQLRYKRWGGLYSEMGRYLYINRGFGFLGFPGRVGMPPEITLLELRRSS